MIVRDAGDNTKTEKDGQNESRPEYITYTQHHEGPKKAIGGPISCLCCILMTETAFCAF